MSSGNVKIHAMPPIWGGICFILVALFQASFFMNTLLHFSRRTPSAGQVVFRNTHALRFASLMAATY